MSRGPGCVERAIIAALTPDNALTTQELCERCYDEPIIKKHRVAVLRALKRVRDRRQDIATLTTEGLGSHRQNLGLAEPDIGHFLTGRGVQGGPSVKRRCTATVWFSRLVLTLHGSLVLSLAADVVVPPLHTRH